MKQAPSDGSTQQRSLMDRISQVLTGEPQDREQLVKQLREAQQRGLFDADAQSMIEGVLQVADMQARDIMIPRSQMIVVSRDAEPEALLPEVVESGHSRFPVIGESRDEIIGVMLAKDLLRYFSEKDSGTFSMRDILRPAVFVPESKRLNVLLKEFRSSRNHLAIVADEYGGVAGIVTIEDVLEQIVGEIEDEHDIDEDTDIRQYSDVSFSIKALTQIEEFNAYFKTGFSTDEFDTIGGLVTDKLGRVPKRGETLLLDNMTFKVLNADNRRIHLLRLTLSSRLPADA